MPANLQQDPAKTAGFAKELRQMQGLLHWLFLMQKIFKRLETSGEYSESTLHRGSSPIAIDLRMSDTASAVARSACDMRRSAHTSRARTGA